MAELLKALKGERTDYTPCWFMRQAGRFLPEYRKIRESEKDFFSLCKNVEKAIQITYLPVEILKVDGAILFSDILVPLLPLKELKVKLVEERGPIIEREEDPEKMVKAIEEYDVKKELAFVGDIIGEFKTRYPDIPLIGFCGAPFTLLSYVIEGGGSKNFYKTKEMMYNHEKEFKRMMENITHILIEFGNLQIESGVDAFQIFDSWVGVLSDEDYNEFVFEETNRLIIELKKQNIPIIYFSTGTSGILKSIKKLDASVFSVDWRIPLEEAINIIGRDKTIQGNLDPTSLLLSREKLTKRIDSILLAGLKARAHIFNLGHGILPFTDPETVRWMVSYIHQKSKDLRSSLKV